MGNKAIVKELGVSGYLRYLHLQRPNNDGRDYLQVREEMFKDMSLEEMSKWARQADHFILLSFIHKIFYILSNSTEARTTFT